MFPGWDSAVVYPVDDTPLSQMTQGESQVPVPSDLIQVAVSPRKEFGSFLNKVSVCTMRSHLQKKNLNDLIAFGLLAIVAIVPM